MGKRRTWRWVTRDSEDSYVHIWNLARPKPRRCNYSWWYVDLDAADFIVICAKEFKVLTGITVPISRPIKVNFSAEVIE